MFIAQPVRKKDWRTAEVMVYATAGPNLPRYPYCSCPHLFAEQSATSQSARETVPLGWFPAEGALYHNGAVVYRYGTTQRADLYDLNGRRTNRARIADDWQIRVCSLQYFEGGAK
jgi:hypothetical protein